MSEPKDTLDDEYSQGQTEQTKTQEEKEEKPYEYKGIEPDKDTYPISKPRRIIIKAIITHD